VDDQLFAFLSVPPAPVSLPSTSVPSLSSELRQEVDSNVTFFDSDDEKVAFAGGYCAAENMGTNDGGEVSPRSGRRRWSLGCVQPTELFKDAMKAETKKAALPARNLLMRSFLVGGL
jgi:hypothetical protein